MHSEIIGDATLYFGNCLDVLPSLPMSDLLLVDPPYGIGEHGGACRIRKRKGYAKHENLGWDTTTPSLEVFDAMRAKAREAIIWGGNYFTDKLPPSMGWLYWRKLMGGDFSDGELAWTSRHAALREYTKCPKGLDKLHPCEKPVELLAWCISLVDGVESVLDPMMGSGSTGVACVRMGKRFIGVEMEPSYFDAACTRIRQAYAQGVLFTPASERMVQKGLEL